MINRENWTYCRYKLGDLKALITFGARPDETNQNDVIDEYYVTLMDMSEERVRYQQLLETLDEAIEAINNKYIHFDFVDETLAAGCSSCSNK